MPRTSERNTNSDPTPASGTAPEIGVVLPFRDAERTLARALDSIRLQTFPRWELVAIDDGSTDGSHDIARAAEREDLRIRLVRQDHAGIVAALNRGLMLVRAPIVARMDADDEAFPDRLALQWEALQVDPGLGLVGSQVEYGGDRVRNAGFARYVDWLNSLLIPEAIALARFTESPFAHPSVAFRRELVDRWGGYRAGPFPEDYELWLRWIEAGVRVAKIPRVLLRWNDPPGRLSRADARYTTESFFRAKSDYLARHVGHTVAPEIPRWVWGAGRVTRRRVEILESAGLRVDGFVDIDPGKWGRRPDGRQVVSPEALPPVGACFVLGCVTKPGARDAQRGFFSGRGYVEGRDFLFAA